MGTRSRRKARVAASALSALLMIGSLLSIPAVAGAAELEISLDKSVYAGHDGGASCPGASSVEGAAGSDITFCFVVANTGDEPLGSVGVSDPTLGISSNDMALIGGNPDFLAPGASVAWAYETSIDGDLVNTAIAGAFPMSASGGPSYDDDPVLSEDTATVTEVPSEPVEPAITIDKTVYAGHDNGGSCPGTETVTVDAGADLTFCFQVTNTGNTHLADVTIDDPILGITQDQMTISSGSLDLMAPGDVTFLFYETTAGELDYVNTATTTGTPSGPDGDELPDVQPPTDDDDASVEVEDDVVVLPTADIGIVKLAFAGHNSGAGCATAVDNEPVAEATGSPVTYCFVVTNTGEAHLADVTVDDPTLGITDADMTLLSGDPTLLGPGETVVWYYETTIRGDLTNVASTTGTPAEPDGTPIPNIQPPTDDDDAVVVVVDTLDEDLEADIDIEKAVYEGHNGGAGCATAGDELFAEFGTDITYCFTVTNTGTVYLADITVDDPILGITDADMTLLSGDPTLLAPDESVVWYYETTLDDDITNVASTTGTPVEPDGTELPAAPPSDSDSAIVGQQEVLQEELPATGVDTDVIALIGAALLLAGGAAVLADRRRGAAVTSMVSSVAATPNLWRGHSTAPSLDRATARRRLPRR